MKIKKVEIKGLFGKKDIEWQLNPQVNVLVGENGSGKSTILSIIYCMLNDLPNSNSNMIFNTSKISFSDENILPILRKNNITNTLIDIDEIAKNIADEVERKTKEIFLNKIQDIGNDKKDEILSMINSQFNEINKPLLIDKIRRDIDKKTQKLDGKSLLTIQETEQIVENETILKKINTIMISTLNLSANANFDFKENQMEVSNILDTKMENIVYQFSLKENNAEIQERLINSLNFFLNMIGKYAKYEKNSIRYFYQDNQQGLNFSNLSSGERQLIYMLVQVALNATETDKSSIVLMDEPEISLHLDWQENFINQLIHLSPNTQFIIVTHSPAIIMNGWNAVYLDMKEITK